MSTNLDVTDRDCINLSELVYQDIESLKSKTRTLDTFIFDGTTVKAKIMMGFSKYAKELATFPHYYIPTFEKYKLIDIQDNNDKSGYYAAAFLNIKTNDIIIANRGTETDGWENKKRDLVAADTGFVFGETRKQFADGIDFYKKISKDPILMKNCKNMYLTGHSLGGGIAALQFLYYYNSDNYLKEIRTFEAPGVGMIAKNTSSPGDAFPAQYREYSLGTERALETRNRINSGDTSYHIQKRITTNYDKMSKIDTSCMKEYGTNLDFIYNDLPHIGNTINPLSKNGVYEAVFPQLLRKGFAPNVFHSMTTYKIYALESNDNIKCGFINTTYFFKMIIPELRLLKLDNNEIIKFLGLMHDGKIGSESELRSLLKSRFAMVPSPLGNIDIAGNESRMIEAERVMEDNGNAIFNIYRYCVVFGFLKSSAGNKTAFLQGIESVLTDGGDIVSKSETESSIDEAYQKEIMVMQFEAFNNIFDLESIRLKEILKKSGTFITEQNYLAYEHLLELSTGFNHSYNMNEEMLCRGYWDEYQELCKKNADVSERINKLDDIFFRIESWLSNGMFDI